MTKYNIVFNDIAKRILNESILLINNIPHYICEVEFYLYSVNHPDPFTHKDKEQSIPNNWYFHKKGGNYKSGTFKGLDMTFRPNVITYNKKYGMYGGMLIRSISKLTSEEDDNGNGDNSKDDFIEGPCRVVDYILKLCNESSVKDFVNKYGVEIKDNESLRIAPRIDLNSEDYCAHNIYNSPRVGLTLKDPKEFALRKEYIMQNYRYLVYPHKYKRNRKLIACQLLESGNNSNNICQDMRMSTKQVDTLVEEYKNAKNIDIDNYKFKTLKVDDTVNLMSACNGKYKMSNDTTKIINNDYLGQLIDELYR
jgi:hypothetical protein